MGMGHRATARLCAESGLMMHNRKNLELITQVIAQQPKSDQLRSLQIDINVN